ncbi:L,D-transpeptidase [Flavobacterium cyanobacteriorum]|uniref:L,D-transpeptidase n=1 Tax=Flavobacterium cyanobacteriorum TaxID=2022802 RepID=A0A255Z411_9FLAO|nr:L,D-transpeptidase family protein [Flavobacterium cyanobacteriorum]OYQ35664.1 L,D-transpeptidase [Flavobacterium cyanobacteriorum]
MIRLLQMLVLAILFTILACKRDRDNTGKAHVEEKAIMIDSTSINAFFAKYPEFNEFSPEVKELYKKHNYHYIWHDRKGLIEFAEVLFNRVTQIDKEGLPLKIPYSEKLNALFFNNASSRPDLDAELLVSAMYFYWAHKVYKGLDDKESRETGWYLPREKVSYVAYLDTLMKDPGKIDNDKGEMFAQYYNLKKALHRYREIEKNGGWGTITLPEGIKVIKPGDSLTAVSQVRKRLHMEGYLDRDSGSSIFDKELTEGLTQYAMRHRQTPEKTITPALLKDLNTPVGDRIKTISVNMERCRWVSPEINTAKEFIAVNIPSYWLVYSRDGSQVLTSRVVVGKDVNKTIVFSGQLSYLVFSPYWNVPNSILEEEIKPKLEKNPNYLEEHNMEWYGKRVRQKPGSNNSLGLVKFMFPNSNNIYLHDTPAKSLFKKDERAYSHGCVRVEKARELAIAITKNDGGWNAKKVDHAMNSGKENSYILKKKIPVYIAYFTAWADDKGSVAFFEDVYERDNRLAAMLYIQ